MSILPVMKKFIPIFKVSVYILLAGYLSLNCKSRQTNDVYLGVSISEIETALTNELSIWYPRIVDSVHGGYWTNFEYDWTLSKDQEKMLVTQARGLWTASRAAPVFPDNKVYRKAADHGYEFLTNHMWDEKNGGFCQYYFTDSSQNGSFL